MMVDGFKKAALKLYTLGTADREWVLGQLDEKDRGTLLALMAELKSAGIKPVFLPFDELIDQPMPAAAPARSDAGDVESMLMALSAADAERLLAGEPDWVAALLCNARPWPWRALALQRMAPTRRRRIQEEAPDAGAVKPALLAAAFEAALEKLKAERRRAEAAPRAIPTGRGLAR